MNERDLTEMLQGTAGDDDDEARQRAWRVVQGAYTSCEPRPRSRRRHRAVLAVAAALVPVTVVGAAAASAPDSGVGRWVRGVVGSGEKRAQPALARVPGGGRLLVGAGSSTWVVSADGSKRRLGTYSGASWSPHGLFVIAWRDRELSALDPGGAVRWSIARPERITSARWGPIDGFRVAYLSGTELRVVNGDGTRDHRYGPARPDVAPAWRPDNTHVIAYVDQRDRVNVAAVDSRQRLWRSTRLAGLRLLAWSLSGRRLLVVTRHHLALFDGSGRRLATREIGAGAVVEHAAWEPDGPRVAVVRYSAALDRSEVVSLDSARTLRERLLFSGPGRFGGPTWSPSGGRLLIPWRDADQWLFLRPGGAGRLAAVANIARQFAPGAASAEFPRSVQWCCSAVQRNGP